MSQNDPVSVVDDIPMVLLGQRAAVKEDLQVAPYELVFGSLPRLPGQLLSPASVESPLCPTNLIERIQQFIRSHPLIPPKIANRPEVINPLLHTTNHVFDRDDGIKSYPQQPYDGPFRVIRRNVRHMMIVRDGKEGVICIDRLKPAYRESELRSTSEALPRQLMSQSQQDPAVDVSPRQLMSRLCQDLATDESPN